MSNTEKNTSTPKDSASASADSASSSMVPASVRIARVGSLVSAKVRMVGAMRVSRTGPRPSKRKKPSAD